jgi:type III pantothenate kinase
MNLWNFAPEFIKTTASAGGVRNAYPIPEQHGVDRWLGIIAARASYPGLVCVANVGTAMTIDAVDATGQHLGGLIVPGPDLMIGSLLRNTSDIALHAQRRDPDAGGVRGASQAQGLFADNTLEGVRLGAMLALSALIDRSVESLRGSYQETPTLLLSGGASERVAGCLLSSFATVPDLVLRGLVVLASAPRV